nr:pyridoxal phosphate-dependent aminotransferase [Bacteroidota bacterium]
MNHNLLSKRVNNLSESETLAMTRRSRQLKEQGNDVINLSIGEPDFNTPDCIKESAIDAINNNITHYTPVSGYKNLRQAISDKFKRENNLDYTIEQIVVSSGAKQSIANTLLCLLNDGDEVLIPEPYWVSYPEMVKLAGGVPVFIPSSIGNDYKVTPQQVKEKITPKSKVFLFSSPCNPSGTVYTRQELKALAGVLAEKEDLFIISDEIYEYINFNGRHESIAQFDFIKDRVITVNGVSKGFAMTGWRIGYIGAPQYIAKACDTLQGQTTSGASSISQMAALKAYQTDICSIIELQEMKVAFRERRDFVLDRLKKIPGIKANIPQGAFYVFPDVSYYYGKHDGETIIRNGSDLCMYLLNKVYVALVPGEAFGGYNYVRISYATSIADLERALDRLEKALAALK